jgi:hypothetical protein
MTTTGEANISVVDGNTAIIVPAQSVQVVMGCSSIGTANQVVATRSPATIASTFGYGIMPEYAGLACSKGATVLAIKTTQNAAGTASAVTATAGNTGTSALTVTVDGSIGAFDRYFVKMKIVTGGTRGTAGWTMQLSLDAGRTYGPIITPGTATTYAIPNTGITLNFGVGTFVALDSYTFATVAPSWADAGILAALSALQLSGYALTGWGSMKIVGLASAASVAAVQGYLETLVDPGFIYTRTFMEVADVSPAAKWGGSAEAEATWIAALQTAFSASSAKRVCVGAGHYNMPSAFPNASCGTPRYRRNLSWAGAARQVQIPPQRHSGRVRDGGLEAVVLDPILDPLDGFIYHDERINPGLDTARFMSARTRIKKQGLFIVNPKLMSPVTSDFSILPLGNVMDIACGIIHDINQDDINDDLRSNANGTLYETDARTIESKSLQALQEQMISKSMISGATVAVDRTNNARSEKVVNISVTITSRTYVLTEIITIAFANSAAA